MVETLAQSVTVIHPNATGGDQFHVHAIECADLGRYRTSEKWNTTGFSKQEIASETYADQIDEGSSTPAQALAEHKFMPCVVISDAPRKWEVDVTLTIEARSQAEAKAKATELVNMIAQVS